jgi:predicted DNA-binding protein with PD1-like motif
VLENPFIGDDVGANGVRNMISGVVGDQGSKFFFHGITLARIDEGNTDRGGHRRQGVTPRVMEVLIKLVKLQLSPNARLNETPRFGIKFKAKDL